MSKISSKSLLNTPLGRPTTYPDHYDSSLLMPILRASKREELGICDLQSLPFSGADFWTGYELSWLNLKGKPEVAILHCKIPCQSPNIIESKSFKLYLNSFNQSRFESAAKVSEIIAKDLSEKVEELVSVNIEKLNENSISSIISNFSNQNIRNNPTDLSNQNIHSIQNIDHLDVEINDYNYNPLLLKLELESDNIEEELTSDLLKSNCLVTGQPDWGSVYIKYHGPKIDKKSLLKYLISFRRHEEFHEQCVERIFVDLNKYCHCKKLTVYARYLRRGGLDINPLRTNDSSFDIEKVKSLRLIRQ